jgi:hypothetical protein
MNTNLQLATRTESVIDAGSLTAQWLLWGLPERLGLAAVPRVSAPQRIQASA